MRNWICLNCKRDDVESNDDCTEHKCLDCGYIPEQAKKKNDEYMI